VGILARSRPVRGAAVVAAGVGVALGLAACSPTPANLAHGPLGVSQAKRAAGAVIYIKNLHYQPDVVRVPVGTNILVVNDGGDTLSATNGAFGTRVLAGGGDDASFVVTKPGTYHVYDQLNPFIKGTIYVTG
jgi:plastocyanin